MRSGYWPYPILVLTALAMLAGSAVPSSAALRDLWPFGHSAPPEPVPDPLPYVVTFAVTDADRRLERALRDASALVGQQETPASAVVGLIARARQDVGHLTAVLYQNARYGGEITITIERIPLDKIDPFVSIATKPVPVGVTVKPGNIFVFGHIEAAPLPPGLTLSGLGLVPGKPADSAVIVEAEAAIVDVWRQQGHPLAAVAPRDTVADHRTNTLDVTISVDPGPMADFGKVTINGTDRVDPNLVLQRAGITGGPYSLRVTKSAEARLRDLGVFESVRVTPAEQLDPDGTIPITITVVERKPRVIGASVNYSNTDGLGAEVYWRHRNLLGGAEQLQLTASIARLLDGAFDPDFRLAGTFRKPAVHGPMTDFTLRATGYRETTEAYRVTAAEAEVGLEHAFSDALSGAVGLEIARSRTMNTSGQDDHLVTTLTGTLEWDTRDNRLDPSEGLHGTLTGAPAYDFLVGKPFATFSADIAAYRSFGDAGRFVLAGRVAAAVLGVDNIADVAPDRRLYAGGASSVRGYAYKNIGPRNGLGELIGGRSSVLLSGELRYRVSDRIGLVGFVDAGNAYSSILPSFGGLKVGVGGGLRYLTPVGPIRLDLAVPLQPQAGDPAVAVYVGIGQAF